MILFTILVKVEQHIILILNEQFLRGKVKCFCYRDTTPPAPPAGVPSGSGGSSGGSGESVGSGSGEGSGQLPSVNCGKKPTSRATQASKIQPSSRSEFDIFDEYVTYSDTKFDITCCRLDGSSMTVSCGQGVR